MATTMETFPCEPVGADEAVVEQCSSNAPGRQESAKSSEVSLQKIYSESTDAGTMRCARTILHTRVSCVRKLRRSNRFDWKCNHCGRSGHITWRCYERRQKLCGSECTVVQCNNIEEYTRMNRQCGTDRRVTCSVEFGELPAQLSGAIGSWKYVQSRLVTTKKALHLNPTGMGYHSGYGESLCRRACLGGQFVIRHVWECTLSSGMFRSALCRLAF